MKTKLVILGSTGSIGTQTLEVFDCLDNFEIIGLSANSNTDLLLEQIKKYKPQKVAVMDNEAYKNLKSQNPDTKVLFGLQGILEIVSMEKADIVVNSLVGNIGLLPTITAIDNKKDIALANKETLVTAGSLIMNRAKKNNVNIYPIDSEHSAIFQCLQGNNKNEVNKIYLTASGGAFRNYTKEELENSTLSEALKHPNWVMGKKITIDSATLMNKGLEVIEARWLFDIEPKNIEVVVHPQSIIHSMVEYKDGSVMAQLGKPDMRTPISYALNYPNRVTLPFEKIDFFSLSNLTFESPNLELFPCLKFAYDALEIGGDMPVVLNASNEVLVSLFLQEKIRFLDIPKLIEKTMSAYNVKNINSVADVINADNWAREFVEKSVR